MWSTTGPMVGTLMVRKAILTEVRGLKKDEMIYHFVLCVVGVCKF